MSKFGFVVDVAPDIARGLILNVVAFEHGTEGKIDDRIPIIKDHRLTTSNTPDTYYLPRWILDAMREALTALETHYLLSTPDGTISTDGPMLDT